MKKNLLILAGLLFFYNLQAQFTEEQLSLTAKGDSLKGSLFVPDNSQKFPVVIIVPGSGPTDRYGNNMLGKSNTYRLMAVELVKNNIGVLLFDKRGIGGSAKAMKKESDLRFDDYVDDLTLWIKKAGEDKRIRNIVVAGHSEGSLIGMIASTKTNLAGYISLAGASRPIDEIIMTQLAGQPEALKNKADSCFTLLKKGILIDSVPPYLLQLFRPSVQPYMMSWMKYNPCQVIQQLKIPVLIIQGTTDLQVAEQEGKNLSACKPDAKFILISNMNHPLKTSSIDAKENIATYKDPASPVNEEMISAIKDFVKNLSKN